MTSRNDDAGPELDQLERMVNLNFRVTERERREFKAWCATNGMTQTEGFRSGFELLKQGREEA